MKFGRAWVDTVGWEGRDLGSSWGRRRLVAEGGKQAVLIAMDSGYEDPVTA